MGLLASLLKVLIIAILISVGGLTVYHWSEGAAITDAFKLTTWDFRFAIKCYKTPSTIPTFVQVNNAGGMALNLALGGETVDNYLSRNCKILVGEKDEFRGAKGVLAFGFGLGRISR